MAAGYGCVSVPKDCGKEGSPCCPSSYRTATNPRLGRSVCGKDNLFCELDRKNGPQYPGSDLVVYGAGTCRANPADCGKLGKPCCACNGGATTSLTCQPENGRKGYCATSSGVTFANADKLGDLLCTQCPDKIDKALKSSDLNIYCGGAR